MGSLIRTLIVLAIVIVVGAYFLGYLPHTEAVFSPGGRTTSTPSASPNDVEAQKGMPAKPVVPSGDELKERAAQAAQRMDETLADAALTTEIRAKIALDDSVKSADISVHTKDAVVTISGTVVSAAQQERILQLARETTGVKSVTNALKVSGS